MKTSQSRVAAARGHLYLSMTVIVKIKAKKVMPDAAFISIITYLPKRGEKKERKRQVLRVKTLFFV